MQKNLSNLLHEVHSCTVCAEHLDHEPRPVLRMGSTARVVIIGQAPGRKVHETGIPWNDPSGVTLRRWLDLTEDEFYDESKIAIVPMGFCFPGTGKSGDKPPRPECAPLWHEPLFEHLPKDRLDIIIGSYAQARYIENKPKTVTETVANWREYLPNKVVMPHPSPRNRNWLKTNPWFEAETVPAVRERLAEVLTR